METPVRRNVTLADSLPFDELHYKELWRRQVLRLFLYYLGPLIVVVVYFTIQYNQLASESRQLHLQDIAGNHANTVSLFLIERIANLENSIDDPTLLSGPTSAILDSHFENLVRISETFVDLGYLDSSGVQTAYTGPYIDLTDRNYSSEAWYQRLRASERSYVVTDIYMGFRQRPHFTIGVKRGLGDKLVVLRASLDPERIYDYIRSKKGTQEVSVSIVNREGYYQVVTPHIGTPLEASSFVPPLVPAFGAENIEINGLSVTFAYSWLQIADWALIVQPTSNSSGWGISKVPKNIIIFTAPVTILVLLIILTRAKKLVNLQKEADRTRSQLEHAAKLASVGELAAGIAHEINNPLAVINEEAGLLKDLMNPELSEPAETKELVSHLDSIQDSVFRCRDITHRLLKFVRKSNIELKLHDLNYIIDGVVDGLLGRELALANIELIRKYDNDSIALHTDKNQLQQVLLNLINNAVDAMKGKPGEITISSERDEKQVRISISDTGTGMTQDQMGKIFLPFYTTKEVGKGTGLGLAVSYGILKDLGGEIVVESTLNVGSTFTISLPQHV